METHRDNKAYERFKHMPDYGKGAVMERLTIRSKNSDMVWLKDAENGNARLEPCEMTAHHNRMALDNLATYEDLEERGRLIKLPCKDVYFIIDINNPKYAMVTKKPIRELAIYEIEDIDNVGCKYFSTEAKAKAKLKELRGVK